MAATARLLARRPDVTAIWYVNDLTALGAIDGPRHFRRRVPDDSSGTGFADIMLAAHVDPPLTTVRLLLCEISAAAVELVAGAIAEAGCFSTGRTLPVELCLHGRTGPGVSSTNV